MSFTNPYPASRLSLDTANSLANGLVGFWALTDGGSSTIAKDITTNANDGTQSGGVSWASTDIGAAASFDGFDDYFDLGDNYDFGDGTTDSAFSISGWIYLDTLPAANKTHVVLSKTSESASTTSVSSYLLGINSSGVLSFRLYDQNGGNQIRALSASSSFLTGQWYHLAGTYTGSGSQTGLQIYINGVNAVDSQSVAGTYVAMHNSTATAKIGCAFLNNATYESFHDGYISNVRIYNRALSATEVATLYNRPWEATNYGTLWPYSPPAPADATLSTDTASTSLNVDLEGWWLCTDGSGTTLVDISGNSVNGTISGTVGWDTTALGTAIEPDGSSGRVDASVSLTGYPITMAAWFKTPSASAADECIMSVADSSVGTNQLRMIIENTTSKLEANGFDGTVVRAASSTTSVDDDEWHLGVAVFASSTSRKIYVDGVLEGTETSSQTMTAFDRSSLAVTADSTPTAYFGGNIQNARVWSRALSDDEITLLYERPFEGITYGDAFHYDPPTPANLTPLDNSSGIMTDCVGWWPLTETDDYASGAADISGSAATFTKAGSVTSDVSSLGTTALFDGVNGTYLRGGTSLLASPSAMTVSAWVNLEAYSSVAGHGIVSRWGSGSTSNQFLLYYPASGTGVRFFVTDGSTNYIAQSTRVPTDFLNRYVHFVGTWDGTDVKLYIDGVEDATIAGPSSINSGGTDNIRIGNYVNDTHPMDGNVANVRIWSRALSAAEVWSIYQNPWLGSAYQASAAAVYYNYILRSKRFRRLS